MSLIPSAKDLGDEAAKAGKALEDNATADLQQLVATTVQAISEAFSQIAARKRIVVTVTFAVEDKAPPAKNAL